ncbi:MAG TPA: ATP-binding protein [Actinomycetota bacterium]|nr:ATP-binding protein [Actinomycetota bacterium]
MRTVGERLRELRRRSFVGRAAEVELFRSALETPEPPFSVLFVYGPGGIGKTTLLGVLADVAAEVGATTVLLECRDVDPTPSGFLAALADALGSPDVPDPLPLLHHRGRLVLLLDSYEAIGTLDGWLREQLLPGLPAGALTVIAGRHPPDAAWLRDPGWQQLLRAISLRNLGPEDARAFLEAAGVERGLHARILDATHGHPLALSLFVDLVSREPDGGAIPPDIGEAPNLVGALLQAFLEHTPSAQHRRALHVCAHARGTTEDLLRAAVPGADASQLFGWMRSLSFVEGSAGGLVPHDLARDLLEADLRWRDPAAYAEIHTSVRAHVLGRLRRSRGREQQRAAADLLFLHRGNPATRAWWDYATLGRVWADRLRPGDRDAILAMAEGHEGPEAAALVRYWMERQPEGFVVVREPGDEVRGFAVVLALERTTEEDRERDPGARAMWSHLERHAPLRPGEQARAGRSFMDRDAYQAPSPSRDLIAVRSIQLYVSRPVAVELVGAFTDPDEVEPMFSYIDFRRASDADYHVAGLRYGVFVHDWRTRTVEEWLETMSERELGRYEPTVEQPDPTVALSHPDFMTSVRRALRDLHRPEALARNPLMRSRVARDWSGGDPTPGSLRELLLAAIGSLATDPRSEPVHRAIDRTYVHPAPTQERAAEVLDLPFSTYRRHLTRGIERIVGWLWDRELYGPEGPRSGTDRAGIGLSGER